MISSVLERIRCFFFLLLMCVYTYIKYIFVYRYIKLEIIFHIAIPSGLDISMFFVYYVRILCINVLVQYFKCCQGVSECKFGYNWDYIYTIVHTQLNLTWTSLHTMLKMSMCDYRVSYDITWLCEHTLVRLFKV